MTNIKEHDVTEYLVIGETPDTSEKLEPGDRLVLDGLAVEPDGEGYKVLADAPRFVEPTDLAADTLEALVERCTEDGEPPSVMDKAASLLGNIKDKIMGEKAAKPMPFVLTERTWAHTNVPAYDIFARETDIRVWNFESPKNPLGGAVVGMPYEASHPFEVTDADGKERSVWSLKRGQSFTVEGGTHFNPTEGHRCRMKVLDTGKVTMVGRDPLEYDFRGQRLKGKYRFQLHDAETGTLTMGKVKMDGGKTLGHWAEELGQEAYKALLDHAMETERLAEGEMALLAPEELEDLVGGWLASTKEGQKVGRRLAGKWIKYLEDLKAEFDEYFGKVAERFGNFLAHARYEDRQETMPGDWASLLGAGSKSGFKSFKGRDGKWRWIAWAASAFEDREQEYFKTKALERYVAEAYKRGDHGKLWFYHLPLAMGDADFTALSGRILLKMGIWADNPIAQKAAVYFRESEGWGASVGYKYKAEDREDREYDWLWVFETSPVPKEKAAFSYSRFDFLGGKRMDITEDQKAKLEEVFGEEWKEVLSVSESASKQLENMLAYKAIGGESDLAIVLTELLADEAIAEKAKANPVQMLKLALGKVKDEAAKGLIQKVIDALEKGDYAYPKPEEKAKEKEEYGKPEKKKAKGAKEEPKKEEDEEDEEDEEPKKGKKEADLPVQIEIEGLNELVEAVKTLKTKVEQQGEELVGLKAMLDASDDERAVRQLMKAPRVVAYKASVAGLLDDEEEGGQEAAKMTADHPLARLASGTPLGPRAGG